jgi:hypothetical protein
MLIGQFQADGTVIMSLTKYLDFLGYRVCYLDGEIFKLEFVDLQLPLIRYGMVQVKFSLFNSIPAAGGGCR